MWEPSQTALPELAQFLTQPAPGLALLRYRSVYAFDSLVRSLQPAGRPLHLVRYRPRAADDRASPSALVAHCRTLASPAIPLIFLCPDPDAEAASDLDAQAAFWKNMNASREAFGALQAQIILTLDQAQTASCFHHAKDLVSWCSPKFEFTALMPVDGPPERLPTTGGMTGDSHPSTSSLTWDTLHPLLEKELQSGHRLSPRAVTQLLIPLMSHAVKSGAASLASTLVPVGDHVEFPDEAARAAWLSLKGDLAVDQGDLAGALRAFSEAKTIDERLAASDPANTAWQRNLSVSLDKLGDLALAQGDLAGALRSFSESKTIAERLAASDPANAAWQRDLSISNERLGNLAVAQGDLDGALRCFTECHATLERLAASDPANAAWQRDLSVSLEKLGDLAVAQGDLAEALRSFSESKTIRERLAASDPANAAWQRDLSVSLEKLGDRAVDQGDLTGALRSFTESKTIRERLAASDPANAAWQRDLWVSYWKLADHCEKSGQPEEAWTWWRKAHDVLGGMKARGLHLSPKDEGFLAWLQRKLAEE